jgi:hypothetical protein
MNYFYLLIVAMLGLGAQAQQEYFHPAHKMGEMKIYKDRLYRGCSDLKEQQDPVSPQEVRRLAISVKSIVSENFSQAFNENPKVKLAFERDVNAFLTDLSCQRTANDCRARLIGLSLYYYMNLRADLPECKTYSDSKDKPEICEVEKRLRSRLLQGVHGSNYGKAGPQMYRKQLLAAKNNATMELFNLLMVKDKTNLHICNSVQSGLVHHYALETDEPGQFVAGVDPEYDPRKNIPKECVEEKVVLYSEFYPANFDEGRSTVGRDQVEPIKKKIADFLKSHPEVIPTDITVISSSSKTPFYKNVGGKKVIDTESDKRNLSIAKERAFFVERALSEIKESSSLYKTIAFTAKAELAGPDFVPTDLNDRFVTRMTPGYVEKIESMYKKYEKSFKDQALKESAMDLLDEAQFVNLYQAKFKPFHGFKIVVTGHVKEDMKCTDLTEKEPASSKASRQ